MVIMTGEPEQECALTDTLRTLLVHRTAKVAEWDTVRLIHGDGKVQNNHLGRWIAERRHRDVRR